MYDLFETGFKSCLILIMYLDLYKALCNSVRFHSIRSMWLKTKLELKYSSGSSTFGMSIRDHCNTNCQVIWVP